jgi:hypothetical protein
MALLGRIAWLVARLILSMLTILLHLLFRLLLRVLRLLLDGSFSLVTTALLATVSGPTQSIERMASEWTQRLLAFGVSPEHLYVAYRICRFLAALVIVLGWLVAALFTLVVIRVVSGILT